MPKQNNAERSNDNTGNTRCGIVRHPTLWLRPVLVGQFEFVEWTQDAHLRHSRFIRLRTDKTATRETANHAAQQDPSLIQRASEFYAQYPSLVQALGAGAAIIHLESRHVSSAPVRS
jgi:ATP-dependent DNA ligase